MNSHSFINFSSSFFFFILWNFLIFAIRQSRVKFLVKTLLGPGQANATFMFDEMLYSF